VPIENRVATKTKPEKSKLMNLKTKNIFNQLL